MPLRHIPLVDNASFTIQNTLRRKSRKQQILVIYVRKAKIMENTMGHECCKIGPVPMKSMFFMKCCSMVFGGFCFKQILLYSGFCDTIYGEIHIWRIQWIRIQMGIWQPHKRQMQPIVPKCYQTHTFWGTFFKLDPHCVYVVRIAVSYKHILWLWLWLFSSTGMPVQSGCLILKSPQCYVNRTIANLYYW